MTRITIRSATCIALFLSLVGTPDTAHAQWTSLVDPFIGTGGTGHTFPGATTPFGMVQLSPDTRVDSSWEGCAGYYYTDPYIYGFTHTHLTGPSGVRFSPPGA
ncbi:MAG: hypothetical protein IIB09_04180 [Bacteroidetes bacterium]|nr:hypothetical protein [Bacteroidota bacterium]